MGVSDETRCFPPLLDDQYERFCQGVSTARKGYQPLDQIGLSVSETLILRRMATRRLIQLRTQRSFEEIVRLPKGLV